MDPVQVEPSDTPSITDSTDHTQEAIQVGEGAVGLYFAYKGARAKVESLAKISGSAYFLRFFGQAILHGYENTITTPKKPTHSQNQKPWHQSLPRLPSYVVSATIAQGVFSGFEDTVLGKVQEDIKTTFFSWRNHKERIVRSFNKALEIRLKKIKDAEEHLVKGAFFGDDFTHLAGKNVGAIGRRLRATSLGEHPNIDTTLFTSLYELADRIPAVCSAGTSAFFVELNALGRALGTGLAILSKTCLGTPTTRFLAKYINTPLLLISHLYTEVNELLVDYVWGATNKLWDTLFYPVASGIMIGAHEAMLETSPNARKVLAEMNTDTMTMTTTTTALTTPSSVEARHQTVGVTAKTFWKNILDDWKTCWDSAKKYYEKYDKIMEESTIEDALIDNATASKRLLLCRHAFLQLTSTKPGSDEEPQKKPAATYPAFKEAALFALRLSRAVVLSTQMFASKQIFSIIKFITKGITNAAIKTDLAKHIAHPAIGFIHGFSKLLMPKSKQPTKRQMRSESPTGSVVTYPDSPPASPTGSVMLHPDSPPLPLEPPIKKHHHGKKE